MLSHVDVLNFYLLLCTLLLGTKQQENLPFISIERTVLMVWMPVEFGFICLIENVRNVFINGKIKAYYSFKKELMREKGSVKLIQFSH